MKSLIKILVILIFAIFVSASFAQDSTKTGKHHHMDMKEHMKDQKSMDQSTMDKKDMDHKMMNHDMMNHNTMDSTKTERMNKNSIVREGVINVEIIDENGDGKVFQDMMDWNVISDEAGKCPLCGMKLKEVSLDKAKANLEKNGYKVK